MADIRKKADFITSSLPANNDLQYNFIALFKWGGDINTPFEMVPVDDVKEDVDRKLIAGILPDKGRCKLRKISIFPNFSVSIVFKLEKSELFFDVILFHEKISMMYLIFLQFIRKQS